jgi:hypothetical protein
LGFMMVVYSTDQRGMLKIGSELYTSTSYLFIFVCWIG